MLDICVEIIVCVHKYTISFKKRGFDLMMEVATNTQKKGRHLVRAAQYNIGRAYFQGFGCKQSEKLAERYIVVTVLLYTVTTLHLIWSSKTSIHIFECFLFYSTCLRMFFL